MLQASHGQASSVNTRPVHVARVAHVTTKAPVTHRPRSAPVILAGQEQAVLCPSALGIHHVEVGNISVIMTAL